MEVALSEEDYTTAGDNIALRIMPYRMSHLQKDHSKTSYQTVCIAMRQFTTRQDACKSTHLLLKAEVTRERQSLGLPMYDLQHFGSQ